MLQYNNDYTIQPKRTVLLLNKHATSFIISGTKFLLVLIHTPTTVTHDLRWKNQLITDHDKKSKNQRCH